MFKNLQETISRVFASQKVDNESLILFEDTLIQADIDIETSEKIINELRSSRFSDCLLYTSPSPRDVEEWGVAGWGG